MDKINNGAYKLRVISGPITHCADNTVSDKSIEDDFVQDESFVVIEEPLQPNKPLFMELKTMKNELVDYKEIDEQMCFHLVHSWKDVPPPQLVSIGRMINNKYSFLGCEIKWLDNIIAKTIGKFSDSGTSDFLSKSIMITMYRYIRSLEELKRHDKASYQYTGVIYLPILMQSLILMFKPFENKVLLLISETDPTSKYLVIKMSNSIRQIRTLPLLSAPVPSLQCLSRKVIIKSIGLDNLNFKVYDSIGVMYLKELQLPECIIENIAFQPRCSILDDLSYANCDCWS